MQVVVKEPAQCGVTFGGGQERVGQLGRVRAQDVVQQVTAKRGLGQEMSLGQNPYQFLGLGKFEPTETRDRTDGEVRPRSETEQPEEPGRFGVQSPIRPGQDCPDRRAWFAGIEDVQTCPGVTQFVDEVLQGHGRVAGGDLRRDPYGQRQATTPRRLVTAQCRR